VLDLLLEGADVHDGTGQSARRSHVGIRDGRIATIESGDPPPARRRLPLHGLALAPGFIDPHSHADLVLAQEPDTAARLLAGRIAQGITSVLVGNCGMGAAPVTEATEPSLRRLNGWMTPATIPWTWTRLSEYLDELERRPLPLNVGALQAHGPLRLEAMGHDTGRPSTEQLAAMRHRLRESLDAGALGCSAGLIYAPGMHADTRELVELGREVADADGVFACHLRGSSELLIPAVEELITVGRDSGCRVHHSHSEAVGRAHWDKIPAVLAREEAARASGVRVSHDLFPYHAAATMMAALFPPAALAEGIDGLLDRLRESTSRERLRREVEETVPAWPPWVAGGWPHNLVRAVGWESIRIASVADGADDEAAELLGEDLAALGRRRGVPPFDALADLMLAHGGDVGQLLFGITGDAEDDGPMRRLLGDPHGAICTDAEELGRGLPHPAAYGSFPRILGRWVREKEALSLPEAIRRMTSLPADLFGLSRRGRIRPGFHADLVAFDPETVADRADYREPRRPPTGIHHVLVNGVPAVEFGRYLGGAGGEVLRH